MELRSLMKTLDRLYNRYNQSPSPDLLQKITDKKQALDLLLSEKALRWSKVKFMLCNNSSSTMFARKLNQAMKPSHTYKLRNPTGVLVSHPNDVMKVIVDYYKNLFAVLQPTSDPSTHLWFSNLTLPTLSMKQLEALNAPCTETEITAIIKSLKTSTAPGPDGYSTSYYKKFSHILSPKLATLYNHILRGNNFPAEMLLANMSLIHKPHKDHSLPQNFRPILVINNDLKIFGRLLADRLSSVITTLISPDQTEFIPEWEIMDNIRLVTNIIQDANSHSKQTLLLSLDINKAFDSVSWSYRDHLLPRFGITGEFIQGFHAL